MADLSSILAALALSAGFVHPMGHISEASKYGVPGRVDYKNLVEEYDADKWGRLSAPEQASIHAAGFKAQDDVARAIMDAEAREAAYIANAILKGGYALGIPDKLAKGMVEGGDIGEMSRLSGNRHVRTGVGLSALLDLLKSQRPQQNWDVGIETMPGSTAVGPVLHLRW